VLRPQQQQQASWGRSVEVGCNSVALPGCQVAGLDVGWHTTLPMAWDSATSRYLLERVMVPGRYQYKYVVDGHWTYSADHPTMDDGGNINNWLEVLPHEMDIRTVERQSRLLQPGNPTPHPPAALLPIPCTPHHPQRVTVRRCQAAALPRSATIRPWCAAGSAEAALGRCLQGWAAAQQAVSAGAAVLICIACDVYERLLEPWAAEASLIRRCKPTALCPCQ
jgi:hypothetical protein